MIGQISYFAGAIAFAGLAIALATIWRGRLGPMFLVAVSLTAGWCLVLALHARYPDFSPILVFASELVRDVGWLIFLVSLMSGSQTKSLPSRLGVLVHGLWVSVLVIALLTMLFNGRSLGTVYIFSAFVLALAGLVITEQVYRNTLEDPRWSIKFLCLGLAGLFAFDLFLYAKGLMFRGFSEGDQDLWNARGVIHVLVAPLLALTAARSPKWSPDLFLSRQMAFYTTALFGAGLSLLTIAAGGYYIKIWGGEWGTVAQTAFVFGGVLVLLVMFFSGQFRARIKVFLNKHFFRYKYDYREEWLRLTGLLSSSDEGTPLRDRAIVSLAKPVESPGGALWLRADGGDYVLAARWNLRIADGSVAGSGESMARFLGQSSWVIDISEWRRDRTVYADLELPDWLQQLKAAWLVVPLMKEEELHGFVVLAQPRAPQKLTWEDLDLLKTVGRQVAGYLALEEAAALVAEASQFQAFNRFTAFIMHDLKNLIAQQSLVVKNAARHKNNPEFVEDAISTVDNSVRRMSRLLEQLRQGDTPGMVSRVVLGDVCHEVANEWRARGAVPAVTVEDTGLTLRASRERLTAVLGHIVRNAQDAAGVDGEVRMRVFRRNGSAVIEVADNGPGMDDDFVRTRLFRPFESTKGSKGMGIGAYQAREFARSLGGDVEVYSIINEGTRFQLVMPIDSADTGLSRQQQTGAVL